MSRIEVSLVVVWGSGADEPRREREVRWADASMARWRALGPAYAEIAERWARLGREARARLAEGGR